MSPSAPLFQVYLRLRPPLPPQASKPLHSDPWLIVEPPSPTVERHIDLLDESSASSKPTHIILQPPSDSRKRAVEKFGFTKVFQEEASQLGVFEETGAPSLVNSVLNEGRDGLVATLGVTGSGKSHTIFGSKAERGVTQMALDIIFRSIGPRIRRPDHPELPFDNELLLALQSADPSEAQILSASNFLDVIYNDGERGRHSRAQTPMVGSRSRAETPMTVWNPDFPGSYPPNPPSGKGPKGILYPSLSSVDSRYSTTPVASIRPPTIRLIATKSSEPSLLPQFKPKPSLRNETLAKLANSRSQSKENPYHGSRRHLPTRPSALPQIPDVASHKIHIDESCDYVVLISMYEVYNDRIFDLLSSSLESQKTQITTRGAALQKELRRRPLLFKSTELSPDKKVVAGLRKVVCGSYEEAMMVLETGLNERRVAGTGSNSVSSRSHGFFSIEVKQKSTFRRYDDWEGNALSIVDLAGSERARNAKTAGATLAEAGKINESLMYLGQCLQMQSDCQQEGSKPTLVPFRQCKLTELLFSNSFPSQSHSNSYHHRPPPPQKAVMIVTADPDGDFNATSQILRYSALAREVTVPRIPSTTSTHILPQSNLAGRTHQANSGRSTPPGVLAEELDAVNKEVSRLDAELDALAIRCAQEEILRREAELRAAAAEEKAVEIEIAIREEVWAEMEDRLEEEKHRWRAAWENEKGKNEEYLDEKVEILGRTSATSQAQGLIPIYEDPPDHQAHVDQLERENEILKAKLADLEREIQTRSPTKAKATPRRSSPRKKQSAEPLRELRNSSRLSLSASTSTNPFLDSDDDQMFRKSLYPSIPGLNENAPLESSFDLQPKLSKLSLTDSTCDSISLNSSLGGFPSLMQSGSGGGISVPKTPMKSAMTGGLVPKKTPAKGETPNTAKKVRKLTGRRWDLGDEDEID
ncbi:MAG: hypothetical protein Q9227_007630 [Pyrenula ochraceoflavens]